MLNLLRKAKGFIDASQRAVELQRKLGDGVRKAA